MNRHDPRTVILTLLVLGCSSIAWGTDLPWVRLSVPTGLESNALRELQAAGIPAIGWSNALVQVSAFQGLESVPLAQLEQRLTAQDPRWDPWLRGALRWFEARNGFVSVAVPADQADAALRLLGATTAVTDPSPSLTQPSPRLVTGLALIFLTLLFAGFRVVSAVLSRDRFLVGPRGWFRVAVVVLLVGVGSWLVATGPGSQGSGTTVRPAVSWVQHRWYQENWPWGATWEAYVPGRAWDFRDYAHRDGRLTEVVVSRPAPGEAWATAAWAGLDPHDAARVFGPENP